jgi:two-component system LytT family response regulator
MPELDGLGVVPVLKRKVMPLIVFVTAYEEHALGAFELNAVDYLPNRRVPLVSQRPYSRVRLERADLHCVGSRPGQIGGERTEARLAFHGSNASHAARGPRDAASGEADRVDCCRA